MADKTLPAAKAGDVISADARRRLAKLLGGPRRLAISAIQIAVAPKSAGTNGQWICIDCGELPQNNMQAWGHMDERPGHRLAWRNFESGKIEEP